MYGRLYVYAGSTASLLTNVIFFVLKSIFNFMAQKNKVRKLDTVLLMLYEVEKRII